MKCCNNQESCGCNKFRPLILLILAALLGFGAYKVMTKPDERTTMERLGDAVKELPNGADKAVKQLEDRTPAEQLQDKAKELVK